MITTKRNYVAADKREKLNPDYHIKLLKNWQWTLQKFAGPNIYFVNQSLIIAKIDVSS